MGWLVFISEVVKALAWPSLIGVIVYLLKGPIANAFTRLSEIEVSKGAIRGKLQTNEEVRVSEKVAQEIKAFPDAEKYPQLRLAGAIGEIGYRFDLCEEIPVASMQTAWNEVRGAAEAAVKRLNLPLPEFGGIGRALGQAQILIPNMQRLYYAMAQWAREAEAKQEATPFDAARFVEFANIFREYLNKIETLPPQLPKEQWSQL